MVRIGPIPGYGHGPFALTDYLKQSGELEATMRYELYLNEVLVATESLTPENWLKAPSRFRVPSASIADQNLIKVIRAEGEGTLSERRCFLVQHRGAGFCGG